MNSRQEGEEETIGEFTDIKDKNGLEIFEGDILSCSDGSGKDWKTHVLFDIENGSWHRYVDYKIGEAIGNVHDNPE